MTSRPITQINGTFTFSAWRLSRLMTRHSSSPIMRSQGFTVALIVPGEEFKEQTGEDGKDIAPIVPFSSRHGIVRILPYLSKLSTALFKPLPPNSPRTHEHVTSRLRQHLEFPIGIGLQHLHQGITTFLILSVPKRLTWLIQLGRQFRNPTHCIHSLFTPS